MTDKAHCDKLLELADRLLDAGYPGFAGTLTALAYDFAERHALELEDDN